MKNFAGLFEQLKQKPKAREAKDGRFKSAPARHPYRPEPLATPRVNEAEDISGEQGVHKGQYRFKKKPQEIGLPRSEAPIIPEEIEQIEEISKQLATGYMHSAISDRARTDKKVSDAMEKQRSSWSKVRHKNITKMMDKSQKRTQGISMALSRVQKEEVEKKKDDVPFDPPYTKKKSAVAGKHGQGYSTARHLARQAMEKYKKKPVKESLQESRKAEIVKQASKDAKMKAKEKVNPDKFQPEPTLDSQIIKTNN